MSALGFRDGAVVVKNLQLEDKKITRDVYQFVVSSANLLKGAQSAVSTAAFKLGTYLTCPRALKVVNALEAASERKMKLVIKGYDAHGKYSEEILTLSSNATGVTSGNVAFAHVTSIVPAVSTKGYGTYGTITIKPTDKIGLTEYVEGEADILRIDYVSTTGRAFVSTTTLPNSTTFSVPYQTLSLVTKPALASTCIITYLSKFQSKR